jgi:hypothetical protein
MTDRDGPMPSVDTRTRAVGGSAPVDAATFWQTEWAGAIERNGARAASDAERLDLPPLTIVVDGDLWTLRRGDRTLEVVPGSDATALRVSLDADAFADLVQERRTAMGLGIAGRVEADGDAHGAFWEWDAVLRSALDGRGVHRPGDVTLRAIDGAPLDLDQQFRMGDRPDEAAHFLAEAGFLLLQGVFTSEEIDAIDADLARSLDATRPADGRSWWASTDTGEQYPCRILDFAEQSATLRDLFTDPRYLAVGELLGDGHRPGDPFGEHFADVTAEGLVKKVGSVDGLVCLPWHKDCQRGGHSMYCSGLTVGICLTPVDEAHGGLDVMAGSHRANIAGSQIDGDLDLPSVSLRADRGDLNVHMSCALHRSTHPVSLERRVAYTGFALPPRPGDHHGEGGQQRLRRERAAVGNPTSATRPASGTDSDGSVL